MEDICNKTKEKPQNDACQKKSFIQMLDFLSDKQEVGREENT